MFAPVPVALVAALLLGAAWLASRSRALLIVASLWLAYAVYEYLMYKRVLCSGECNIRVDLLLIYPVMVVATLAAIVMSVVRAVRRKGRGD